MNVTIKNNINAYTFFIMVYFCIAPLEDVLTGNMGTLARYVGVLIVLSGVLCNRGKVYWKRNIIVTCMLYLMALSLVSCLWASDLSVAIERNKTYLLLPAIVLYVGTLEFTEKEREMIITAAIIGGVITVIFLCATGKISLSGTQRLRLNDNNDNNGFAALMFLPFGLSISRFVEKKRIIRLIYLLLSCVFLFVILLSGSRGCLLALITFVVVYILFVDVNHKIRNIILLITLLLLAYCIIVPLLPDFIYNRLFDNDSYISTINSSRNRVAFWKLAFTEIIPSSFPLGVGSGCVPMWLGNFYSYNRGMHNTYINMLCEYGIFGLPVFVFMLGKMLKDRFKKQRVLEAALLIGIGVIIFFLDSYPKKFFWNIVMLLMIFDNVYGKDRE